MDDRDLTRRFLGEPDADLTAKERARRMLDEAIQGPPRDLRRISVAAAAAAAFLILALVWSTARSPSAVARAFQALAATPSNALEPGSDEYLHQTSSEFRTEGHEILGGEVFRVQVMYDIDLWLRSDRSGERRSVVDAVTFPTLEDERAWSTAGAPPLPLVGRDNWDTFAPGQGPLVPADGIPTDPDVLLAALRNGSIKPYGESDADAFALIGDLLAQGNLPEPTRSALLDAAAKLDGVRLLGPDEDALGREGESFSVQVPNEETRLIFDPATGALLSREAYKPDASGTWRLVDWQAYVSVELVHQIPPLEP